MYSLSSQGTLYATNDTSVPLEVGSVISHSIAMPYSHALTVYYTPLANTFS